jgi:hypothetical protein
LRREDDGAGNVCWHGIVLLKKCITKGEGISMTTGGGITTVTQSIYHPGSTRSLASLEEGIRLLPRDGTTSAGIILTWNHAATAQRALGLHLEATEDKLSRRLRQQLPMNRGRGRRGVTDRKK